MKNLRKRAISLIVIATFLISMIPIIPGNAALTTVNLNVSTGDKGDTVTVTGPAGQVTSGSTLEIYWDTAIGSGAQLLNSTTGKADGSYEVMFDIPEATTGTHYIWAKDVGGPVYASAPITVLAKVSLSPDSGLEDDEVTVTGYGFGADEDIEIYWDSSPVVLYEEDDASADWVADTHLGTNAVELAADTDATIYTHADVAIPGSDLVDDVFANLAGSNSFDYKTTSGDTYGPHMCYYISNGTHSADITMITNTVLSIPWTTANLNTASFFWFGDANIYGWAQGPGTLDTLANFIAATPSDYTITKIQIEEGWWSHGSGTAVVDNFVFDGVAYDFEPPIESTTSDDVGTFETTFEVVISTYGTYTISAIDTVPTMEWDDFTLGASITLSEDEGPTGSIVTITGRGWSPGNTTTFKIGATTVEVVDEDTVTVESDGTFTADVVIPNMGSVDEYSITATESSATKGPSSEDYDITGIPEISVDPTYGSPGAVIDVTGANFSQEAGTEVTLELWGKAPDPVVWIYDLGIAETDSDGTIDDSFVSPAVAFESYEVRAVDTIYGLNAEDDFKVGLIALIINPLSGEAGTEMAITGIGFEPGLYNLTFGDEEYDEYGTVSGGEAISDTFYVPNVEPGTYEVVVVDTVDNELTVHFTVTESTVATADPAMAPVGYNITLSGYNFADDAEDVDFVLYNSTDDWAMVVVTDPVGDPTETDDDGNFTGWWLVDADLSNGDYIINVTGGQGLLVQLPFSVVAARVEVTPTKALYDRGNTVKFDISNDFDLPNSYLKIYSPDDVLWWITDNLIADMWIQVDLLYTVPYYRQTANENPMDLASDAPLGTWTYFFYDTDDEELMNGTFAVGPSTAAQVDELLDDVRSDIESLADDLSGLSDDFGDDVAGLSDEIGGVISDMENLRDDIVGDLADDIAAATDAGNEASAAVDDLNDALSDLGDAVGDLSDANADLSDELDAVSGDTSAAREAAEDAQTAASGLTTLVYGAIGASLIAALAAIVSLMQISRRIAG